ncbi:MAG: hypothetical protein Q8N44_18360 [Rubrivivax sp.]|nr:hypothetical protein [Rubrivivax sp.]
MNTIALTLAVACVVASTGLATWIWLSLDSVDDDWRGLADFDGLRAKH